ncbi:(2Fe-2S)-binding protein [Actinomadura flavalba]|uniref:(2Fe-2S)-binding protein n=1 Tax=Actinomadura flavalba TaxID=1120938 RepID=UPI0003A168E7|nr:(2Fe-2S)-binding protein [Actinomadura flavalba]
MTSLRQASGASVAAALEDVASLGAFFAVTVGGPDAGWHPVHDSYAGGMHDLVTATARRYGTEELRIGASMVHLGHAARLWSPVLAAALLHGVVPDLTALQRSDANGTLRLPVAAGHFVDENTQVADVLYRVVVVEHLEPLVAGLRVKVAPRLPPGNAASALVEAARALLAARPETRDRLVPLTGELLETGRLAGTGAITGPELGFLRSTSCCLYYRVPDGVKCEDCSLLKKGAERRR